MAWGLKDGGEQGCISTLNMCASLNIASFTELLIFAAFKQMVTQYENSLRLQRRHAGNVVESALRRRSSAALSRVYSARILPDESPSPAVSASLIPAMRRLKWSVQKDRLAQFVRARSDMVRNGGVVAWLEGRGRAVMRRENERVRLAVCPGIGGMVRFYESRINKL